jgi:hypothetical protein
MKKSYSLAILFCSFISLAIAINSSRLVQNEPKKNLAKKEKATKRLTKEEQKQLNTNKSDAKSTQNLDRSLINPKK